MRLRHIEVFHAIMQVGTISGAAQVLHISQPAVTKVLQRHGQVRFTEAQGIDDLARVMRGQLATRVGEIAPPLRHGKRQDTDGERRRRDQADGFHRMALQAGRQAADAQ